MNVSTVSFLWFKTALTEMERGQLFCFILNVVVVAITGTGLTVLLMGVGMSRQDLVIVGSVLLGLVGLFFVVFWVLAFCVDCCLQTPATEPVAEEPTVVTEPVSPANIFAPRPYPQAVAANEVQPKEERDCYGKKRDFYNNEPQGYATAQPQGYATVQPQGYAIAQPQGYAIAQPQGYATVQPLPGCVVGIPI